MHQAHAATMAQKPIGKPNCAGFQLQEVRKLLKLVLTIQEDRLGYTILGQLLVVECLRNQE